VSASTTSVPRTVPRRGPRPGALAWRSLEYWLTVYRRTWRGSVVSGFASPLLYLGALGFGLGTLVDRSGPGQVAGVAYAVYVAPGVLAANAMQTAVGETTYPVMSAIKWHRQYFAMLATPLGVLDILFGQLAFVVFRVFGVSAAFVAVGALLGAFTSPWAALAVGVATLCGAAHAAPVMAFSARLESDQGFTMLFRFGLIPMFLFAGTFFPIDQLPAVLQPVAWATPLWHATTLCRDLSLGTLSVPADLGHLAYLLLWFGVGTWLAARSFDRRLVR